MQRLTFVGCVVLLMLPVSLMADITIGTSTTGLITVTLTNATTITISFSNPVSGSTIPAGGYSFAGVGPLTFSGCTATGGCPTVSGTAGTLTLPGDGTQPITWTLLDGDSSGYTFNFTTPLRPVGDLFLDPPASPLPQNFDALLGSAAGTTFSTTISSGQVAGSPLVADGGTTVMLLGGALVGLGTLRRRFRA